MCVPPRASRVSIPSFGSSPEGTNRSPGSMWRPDRPGLEPLTRHEARRPVGDEPLAVDTCESRRSFFVILSSGVARPRHLRLPREGGRTCGLPSAR